MTSGFPFTHRTVEEVVLAGDMHWPAVERHHAPDLSSNVVPIARAGRPVTLRRMMGVRFHEHGSNL